MTSSATTSARNYYDSPSSDAFYSLIWGGEDIHIGIYDDPSITITEASQKTVQKMVSTLETSGIQLTPQTRILDMGAGYGGAARYLAKQYGCKVVCLNLSAIQNTRNEKLNKEEGLEDLVSVVEGSFEEVPGEVVKEGKFDIIWSQDSYLHSDHREKIVDEIARLLDDGKHARVAFTDIMASSTAFKEHGDLMRSMMERLSLSSLGSIDFFMSAFEKRGFKDFGYWDGVKQFRAHYQRLGEELERRRDELEGVEEARIEKQTVGLKNWVKAADRNCVDWGIFCFGRTQ